LRGDILQYAAQASPRIDTARMKKYPFRMKTDYTIGTEEK